MPSRDVVEALAVTAELTRTDLTPAGARIFAADLAAYPEAQVLAALNRCRREVRSNLTPADVIGYLHGGRLLAIEVKSPAGQPTALQREWLLRARDAGCCVGVARNAQDVVDIVSGINEFK